MHALFSSVVSCLVVSSACAVLSAWADHYKGPTPPAVYIQECGSCHVAFASNLLPKASWQRVLNRLDNHYGSDASLDIATQREIATWLQTHGGQGKRAREEPPLDRLTRSAWFERKHRKLSADTFSRPAVKSATNCTACHRDAAQGDFDEDHVKVPK